MSTSGGLFIICCTDCTTSPLLAPSHHFNTTHATIATTSGARVMQEVINSIYWADQSTPLGLVIVMGHAGCTHVSTAGGVETTIRTDIQAIKASPYVRKEIQIVGYVVDLYSRTLGTAATDARLREVTVLNTAGTAGTTATSASTSSSGQQRTSNQEESMSPFWS